MELTFLGTAADSAYPLPFCACAICQRARVTGGKNLRRRSSVIINHELLIDLGPDSVHAMLTFGLDPSQIRYLLQTHPHHDHFDQNHLITRGEDYGYVRAAPLTLVASPGTLERMSSMMQATGFEGDLLKPATQHALNMEVRPIQAGESMPLGNYQISAVQANHDDAAESLLYGIQAGGRALLYATDTDTLQEAALSQLSASGLCFATVVMDHTFGPGCDGAGHLNTERFRATTSWLRDAHLLQEDARIYATHLSHEGNPEYDELVTYAQRHGYLIPWDGLTVTV